MPTPKLSSSSSSRRVKYPDTHKQRRPDLPWSNPVERTSKILAPELPGQFMTKRSSIRSHLTAVTHDSHSTAASEHSHVVARKLEDEDDSTSQQPDEPRTSFFIPGITGKARCLEPDNLVTAGAARTGEVAAAAEAEAEAAVETMPLRNRASRTIEDNDCIMGDDFRKSLRRAATTKKSLTLPRGSATATATSEVGGDSRKSGSSSCPDASLGSARTSSEPPTLDQAHQLYDAVIESIHARRVEGMNDLDEEDFQRMVKLLEQDVERLGMEEETVGLREQVTSIQNLLSAYERKKRRKHSKKKRPQA